MRRHGSAPTPALVDGCSCVCCSACRLFGAAVCVWLRRALHAQLLPRSHNSVFLRLLFFIFLCVCVRRRFACYTNFGWVSVASPRVGIFPGCRWAPHTDSAVKLMDNQVSRKSRLATFFRLQKDCSPVRTGGGGRATIRAWQCILPYMRKTIFSLWMYVFHGRMRG